MDKNHWSGNVFHWMFGNFFIPWHYTLWKVWPRLTEKKFSRYFNLLNTKNTWTFIDVILKEFLFPDRIFTFNCMMWMVGRWFFASISEIRWFFGPIGYGLTSLRYYVMSSLLCLPLGIAESVLFRCLMIFSWKTAASINDEYVSRFFAIWNFIIAQMISIIRLMLGQFHHKDYFGLISGVDMNCLKNPR